jgi:phosphate transport system substrate-binding protein
MIGGDNRDDDQDRYFGVHEMKMTLSKMSQAMALSACSVLLATNVLAAEVTGAGSTAIYPVLSQWAQTYKNKTGDMVNYQSIGSGGGIKMIKEKTVHFGDSDMPLKPEQLAASHLVQFPVVIIGITPIVNIPGIKSGDMVLNGKVLADIYLGKITKWNDAAIKALNPKLNLPDLNISVVHRADGSGTTFYFTDYLSKVSPEWKEKVGSNTAVSWPTGVGGKGSEGVAAYVHRITGAIGYDEYAYAKQTNLTWTRMINKEGKVVSPEPKYFQAAASKTDFAHANDFYVIMTDAPGANSWPLTGTTYFLLRTDAAKADNANVVKFAKWFLSNGQPEAQHLDYVPLPGATVTLIEKYTQQKLGL